MVKKVFYGINPLLDDEKQRLCAEYVTLHKNAMTVLEDLKGDSETKFKLEKVRYVLLTEERYYRNYKFVNFRGLFNFWQFLNYTPAITRQNRGKQPCR